MNKLIYFLFPVVAIFLIIVKMYEKQVENDYLETMKKVQERLDKMKVDNYMNSLKQENDKKKKRKKKK